MVVGSWLVSGSGLGAYTECRVIAKGLWIVGERELTLNKYFIRSVPWILLWMGYWIFASWIRAHWDVTAAGFQIHGYDYADYVWHFTDWRSIFYPRPRHPLWGVIFLPVSAVCSGLNAMSPAICLAVINGGFAAVMAACVYLVVKLSNGSAIMGVMYAGFASSLLLGGMPESFGVSALLSLIALDWLVRGRDSRKRWQALEIVAGGVTITPGIKLLLLHCGLASKETAAMRCKRLLVAGMWCVLAGGAIGLAFVSVWAVRKWLNPEYSRTLSDMLSGLTHEFSYGAMPWTDRIAKWWVFLSEPLLTRGTPFSDNMIASGYHNKFLVLLLLPPFAYSAIGMWLGRKSLLVKALLLMLSVDVLIHFVCGWGMCEPQLYAGHWTFAVPILCSVAILEGEGRVWKNVGRIVLAVSGGGMLVANLVGFGLVG